MDRFDSGRDILVTPGKGTSVIIPIFIVLLVIAIVIIVILLLRRNTEATDSTTGTGSTECVNNIDCSGSQVCNVATGKCVDCAIDADCPVESPLCNPATNTCVSCISGDDCSASRPICDDETKRCIQCSGNGDCGGALPICNSVTNLCVGCLGSGDCFSGAPLCNPGTNTCVECISDSTCTLPATCVGGQCCNLTAPSISSITANGNNQTFNGSYTFSQPLFGLVAIFEVEDATGAVLYTAPATVGNGGIAISEGDNANPGYFAGYTYRVKVRLIQDCGITPFSAPYPITMGLPTTYILPVIHDVPVITTSGVTFRLSTPDHTFFVFWTARIYISSTPGLDPNRAIQTGNTYETPTDPYLTVQFPWPIGVSVGQTWYIRVGVNNPAAADYGVLSAPETIIIPAPPPPP